MKLVLPLPPSANRYWRSVVIKGAVRVLVSAEGRAYKEMAEVLVKGQWKGGPLAGEVRVEGVVYFPNRRGDLDNRIKPTLDQLQGVVYANDSQVAALSFVRAIDKASPRIVLTIEEAA